MQINLLNSDFISYLTSSMDFDRTNIGSSQLEDYFKNNNSRLIHKWSHYFDIYERHFRRFKNKPVSILEIGVFHGGSLQMWKDYFGENVQIYGVDINEECKSLEEENIEIFIGSQADKPFLERLKSKVPKVDILIDDGGHTMRQQRATFEVLFDHVKDDGIYLCEDTHSSYWIQYGGGVRRKGTFIEYSKKLIDKLNAFNSQQSVLKPSSFTKTVNSIHFYDSVVVIEKQLRSKPIDLKSGTPSYQSNYHKPDPVYKRIPLLVINKVLRFLRLPGFIWR